MKLYMNYLGFFGLLSLIGIWGLIDTNLSNTITFLICFGYFSYFWVKPDELFKKRVSQTATVTIFVTFLVQLGFYLGFLLTNQVEFFINGFWISFTVLTVIFPVVFFIFEVKDGTL